ncbi:hypothetical protein [Micavibrio aeruginosavorus]|uniref:hypothetical protein n=1 Tax=Micavibrio aeruginosavorus TaxID=349221 RepID=UPI003F4AEA5B
MTDYKRAGSRLVALNVDVEGGFLTEQDYVTMRGQLDTLRRDRPQAFDDLNKLAKGWRDRSGEALPSDRLQALDKALQDTGLHRGASVMKVLSDYAAHGFQKDYHPGFMKNANGRPFMPSIFNATALNVQSFAANHPDFVEPLRKIVSGGDSALIVTPANMFTDKRLGQEFANALRQHNLLADRTTCLALQVQAVAPEVFRNQTPASGRG